MSAAIDESCVVLDCCSENKLVLEPKLHKTVMNDNFEVVMQCKVENSK